jgi:hypothetical protein
VVPAEGELAATIARASGLAGASQPCRKPVDARARARKPQTEAHVNKKLATTEGCNLYTLAKGTTGHVQRCLHCGTLSLHVGPISLRFDPAALESLWSTLGDALLQLHVDLHAESAPTLPARRAGQA